MLQFEEDPFKHRPQDQADCWKPPYTRKNGPGRLAAPNMAEERLLMRLSSMESTLASSFPIFSLVESSSKRASTEKLLYDL